jgi:predicted phosphoadenosine phosphosulfate sulfurtransferase
MIGDLYLAANNSGKIFLSRVLGLYLYKSLKKENMEKYNFNFKTFMENFKKFFSNLGKVAVIVTAMASGYATSEIYHRYEMTLKTHKMQTAKTEVETKVYLSGDNELMLMDIKSGSYQLYNKGVMDIIFNLRANQIYNAQKSK